MLVRPSDVWASTVVHFAEFVEALADAGERFRNIAPHFTVQQERRCEQREIGQIQPRLGISNHRFHILP